MPLVLNEEQRMLRDSTRDFFRDKSNLSHFRALRDSSEPAYASDTWAAMCELGLAGIAVPEAYGGLEFGYLAMGAVFEQSGRQLVMSPLLSSCVMAASLLELCGSGAQKQGLLPALASGETLLAVAIDEAACHNPAHSELLAEKQGDGYLLTGRKSLVIDGAVADKIIVLARTSGQAGEEQGLSLFLLSADATGLNRKNESLLDSRNYAELRFDRLSLAADALLGTEGEAFQAVEQMLDRARACLAAEMLGCTQVLFDCTVDYLRNREQFGARIGSFQALQHRAAHMYTVLELSRSTVMDALSAIDEGRADVALAVSTAKARMNETARLISAEAVQMHGGIGVTDELDVGLYLKRIRVAMHQLGDTGYHQDRFARLSGF